MASGQGITTSSTSISPCENCIATNTTQITHYSIKPGQFAQDLGPVTYSTSLTGFTRNATDSQSLTFGLPSPASAILYNSTLTSIQLSGISFFYKPEGYQTLITITGMGTGASICMPISASGAKIIYNQTTPFGFPVTQIRAGNQIFDWSDIPASMIPSYNASANQLCFTPPIGSYSIDPIALDGSGISTDGGSGGNCDNNVARTCTVTLTTTSSPDVIIIYINTFNGNAATCPGISSVSDTSSLSWSSRGASGCQATPANGIETFEWYAIASGTLTSDVITITQSASGAAGQYAAVVGFGISSAKTSGSPFDPNAALPDVATGTSGSPTVTAFSTSNANDMIIAGSGGNGALGSVTHGTGYTSIKCGTPVTWICTQYEVVSSTQSSISVAFAGTPTNDWTMVGDAVEAAVTTVTQGIQITTLPAGAPSATITIVNCGFSNSTFTADGFNHVYTGVTASCKTTLRNPAAASNARYGFNISPHPQFSININFTTAASGTGNYVNNTYYQVINLYTATPSSPATWDAIYSVSITGTYLGATGTVLHTTLTAAGGGMISFGNEYADYNQSVNFPSTIGNTWGAQAPSSFMDTTGGNTRNVNYVQSAGGGTIIENDNWLYVIPVIFLIFVGVIKVIKK